MPFTISLQNTAGIRSQPMTAASAVAVTYFFFNMASLLQASPQIAKRNPNNGSILLSRSGIFFGQEQLDIEGRGDQAGSAVKEAFQRSDPLSVSPEELRKIEVDWAVQRFAHVP